MAISPILLSVVCVVHNQCDQLEHLIQVISTQLSSLVSDYELIIVDNASSDNSVDALKKFTSQSGYPNLQVYALTKEVEVNAATWAGLENALGDYIAVVDPLVDDIYFLPQMLERALEGADVVFANNQQKSRQSLAYSAANAIFNAIYKISSGVDLSKDAPQYRLMNKRVINFILQHPQPVLTYRHLPATGGFSKVNLEYRAQPKINNKKKLVESIDRGMRLLVSSTQAPMRMVTTLSMFGAAANLFYSLYVITVGIFKTDVVPGWVSMSLQQSGMYFLISLVLLVLGEYILHMASLTNEGPPYHVAQEFTSAHLTRKEKLNLEEISTPKIAEIEGNTERTII